MKKNEYLIIAAVLAILGLVFFFPVVARGRVPFPGDILVSDFQPWRSESYLGYAEGGIPNKAQYPDTVRQIYPWKTLVVESLKKGSLPLWNPYNFSGAPLLANFQSAALYPLGFLYLILPQIAAWTILIVMQPILATLFTYLFARSIRMGRSGAWLASLSYGWSGFMAVWLEYNTVGHVILWLPLILFAIERIRERPRARWFAVLALSNAAAILAGHPQVYAYMGAFALIYAWFRLGLRKAFRAGIFMGMGVGIAGLQLIPGIELIANAARSPHDAGRMFSTILIQPWQLLSMGFPNIFGNPVTRNYWPADTFVGKVTTIGLVPLFFLLSAFRRSDRETRWFLSAAATVLILITANPITYMLYRIPIPLVSASSPTLMSFLLSFSLAILCGFGLEYWITDRHSLKKLFRRSLEVGLILGLLYMAKRFGVSRTAIIYAGLISGTTLILFWIAIRHIRLRKYAVIALLVLHVADLWFFFTRFNPFVPVALVFPQNPIITYLRDRGPDRYWGYASASIGANVASQYHMFSPEGYDPLYPKTYGQFLYGNTKFTNATRSDAAIESHFGDGGLTDPRKQELLSVLGIRYVLDRTENGSDATIFPPERFSPVFTYKDWRVYENKFAFPRAFMNNAETKILSYEPERVVVRADASENGTLILSDTYYPGWTAAVDGHPAPISRVLTAFRGVPVPKGHHVVEFRYDPLSVRIGLFLSMMSIGALLVTLVSVSRRTTA